MTKTESDILAAIAVVETEEPPIGAPRPAKVPIIQCTGGLVECPDCGKPAEVLPARGGGMGARPITSIFWVKTRCPGVCGGKLHKANTPVVPIHREPPGPVQMVLAEAVGKFCRCPVEGCGEKAQAVWRDDLAHAVGCPIHQVRPYPPDTVVEVLG